MVQDGPDGVDRTGRQCVFAGVQVAGDVAPEVAGPGRPERGRVAGQVATVVKPLGDGVRRLELCDDAGGASAMAPVPVDRLPVLPGAPEGAAPTVERCSVRPLPQFRYPGWTSSAAGSVCRGRRASRTDRAMTETATPPPLSGLTPAIDEIVAGLQQIAEASATTCAEGFRPDLRALDAGLYCLVGVLLAALERWGRQHREVVWHETAEKRASPSFVTVGLLAGTVNSVLAVRHLATRGFDRQARVVFRELTEVGDLLLGIVADEPTLDRYLASPEDFKGAYDHWAKVLRPYQIRQRVDVLAKGIGFGNDAGTADLLASRWALYEWLSKSAHVDYGALVVESVAGDLDGRYDINLGGRVGGHTGGTLRHLVDYLHVFLVLMALFLAARHRWTKDDPQLHEPLQLIRQFAGEYAVYRGSENG